MKIVCIIPARYESSRFSGKSTKMINGIPLLKRVYNNALESKIFDKVLVVTWGEQIEALCKHHNMEFISQLTDKCRCGTDAIAEISNGITADYYINLQGDEPLIMPETIKQFVENIQKFEDTDRIAYNAITTCNEIDAINSNIPKVVVNAHGDMLYMSRCPIPYKKSDIQPKYYKELGLHAYTKNGLDFFYISKQSPIEKIEELEFLRFIENGKPVRTIYVELPFKNHAIDVPKDISIVECIMKENSII